MTLSLVAWVAAAAVMLLLARSGWRVAVAAQLARAIEPYAQAPADPARRLLIVGDSTAVGTGASGPAASLAGLIGRAHPRAAIDNRARDGATWADLIVQLEGAGTADVVLVMAGGNDVIRLRDWADVRRDIDQVVARARSIAPVVWLMPAGNVGNAPFFWPPLSWWMTQRSRRVHALIEATARDPAVVYVDLFEEAEHDPFVQQPGLHAADGLHPSDAGYRLWRDQLRRQADLDARLSP